MSITTEIHSCINTCDHASVDGDCVYSTPNGDFLDFDDLIEIIQKIAHVELSEAGLRKTMDELQAKDATSFNWSDRCGYISDSSGWARGMSIEHLNLLIDFVLKKWGLS